MVVGHTTNRDPLASTMACRISWVVVRVLPPLALQSKDSLDASVSAVGHTVGTGVVGLELGEPGGVVGPGVGPAVTGGSVLGLGVGAAVVGEALGEPGATVGPPVTGAGGVGPGVGPAVTGLTVVGSGVGRANADPRVGPLVGLLVGILVGPLVGRVVGRGEGQVVGQTVGSMLVGRGVGIPGAKTGPGFTS